ncbi:MAG: adenylosuccinate synthase [Pelagibacteraceae bacterium]|nr:adenylosuccinate synthase [Pelagibacteraceae bacterium]|tara:strand:- start:692 stop:1972 length:1281 start_codon:yes stop_codon:yes gene_type:complete
MSNVTIVGTQWGDEGKGKIVDWLSEKADLVVRFQGGNNAGHTIQIKDKIYKLSLLPSGIVRKKISVIGNGVVLDPWALKEEIASVKKKGIKVDPKILYIAENTTLVLPFYKDIDSLNESLRGKNIIGTTKRGIGPAYEDKVGRRCIRLCDLKNKKKLRIKVQSLVEYHNPRFKYHNKKLLSTKDIYNSLVKISNFINQYSYPVWKLINESMKKNKKILFEGAQGSLLDIDFGTHPFVTSSNTLSGQIYSGTGLGNSSNYVLGITKAYTTRVGSGPFPTELKNSIGEFLGKQGNEFGTVTNRKRRCGWFDAVLVNQTKILNGLNSLAITKLDVLDKLENIKICSGYRINKKIINYFPADEHSQSLIKPIYISLPGWKSSTVGIKRWDKLPAKAKKYLKTIEKLTNCKITVISTSPERNGTILLESPF